MFKCSFASSTDTVNNILTGYMTAAGAVKNQLCLPCQKARHRPWQPLGQT